MRSVADYPVYKAIGWERTSRVVSVYPPITDSVEQTTLYFVRLLWLIWNQFSHLPKSDQQRSLHPTERAPIIGICEKSFDRRIQRAKIVIKDHLGHTFIWYISRIFHGQQLSGSSKAFTGNHNEGFGVTEIAASLRLRIQWPTSPIFHFANYIPGDIFIFGITLRNSGTNFNLSQQQRHTTT